MAGSENTAAKTAGKNPESNPDFFKTLINTIPNPVFAKNIQGEYILCNKAFEEFVGLSTDDICGKTVFDLYPEEIAQKYREMDDALFSSPGTQTYEFVVYRTEKNRKDTKAGSPGNGNSTCEDRPGEKRDVVFRKATYTDAEGNPAGLVGTITDITEQKKREKEVKKSEKLYRTLFTDTINPVFMVDDNGRYVDANTAALRFLETDMEALCRKTVWDYLPEGTLSPSKPDLLSSHLPEGTIEKQYQVGQAIKTLLLNTLPIRMDGKNLHIGIGQDITLRKKTEAMLERTWFCVENAAVSVFWVTMDGRIEYANKAACTSLGYSREEITRKQVSEIDPNYPAKDRNAYLDQLRKQKTATFVSEHVKKDGTAFPVEITAHLMEYEGMEYEVSFSRDITERMKWEEELMEGRQRFQQLVEHIEKVFWIRDVPTGRLLYISPACESICGIPAHEAYEAEEPFLSLVHPDDLNRVSGFLQAKENLSQFDVEYRIVRGKGNIRWLRTQGFPVLDENGNCTRIVGLTMDINTSKTEEMTLEAALFQSHQRSREISALLESAQAVLKYQVFKDAARRVFDSCRNLLGATAGYVAILSNTGEENEVLFLDAGGLPCTVDPELPMPIRGLRADAYHSQSVVYDNQFMNSRWMEFMPPGHVNLENVLFAPLIIEGAAVGLLGLANKHGGFTENDARLAGVFGEIAAVALRNSQSLEERVRAQEELRQSKQLLEKTVDNLKAALFIVDAQTATVIDVNRPAEEMFGYTKEEMLGRTTEFIHVDASHLSRFRKSLYADTEDKGYMELHEFSMKRKNGNIFPTEHSVAPLEDESGNRIAWVSVVRDISERKQLEERLVQSQKMEALGTLAGGIAHDFNNILFPIVGFAELSILKIEKEHPVKKHMEEIIKAANRARELVRQILTFSRKSKQELHPITLEPVIKEALKLMRASLPSTIEIKSTIDKDCGIVLADPTQIHQVLMNLCANSFHALREKGGEITVTLEKKKVDGDMLIPGQDAVPGDYLALSVSDTGCGIPEDILDSIFEPYFTTKEIGEGTGIGLSVVDGIVKAHHGFVRAESRVREGATFTVFLPLLKTKKKLAPKPRQEELPRGSEVVLLVDDEAAILKMLSQMLSLLGYQVYPMKDSREALSVFRENPYQYDLVITDLTMPHMTGIELSKQMLHMRKDIPIVLCTGYSELIDEEDLQKSGIRCMLMKPVIQSQMANTIRNVLGS